MQKLPRTNSIPWAYRSIDRLASARDRLKEVTHSSHNYTNNGYIDNQWSFSWLNGRMHNGMIRVESINIREVEAREEGQR